MGGLAFDHVILTKGDVRLLSNGPAQDILAFNWSQVGGIALFFVVSAFNTSLNPTRVFRLFIELLNNGVEVQQSIGYPPNNVFQTVGSRPPPNVTRHETFGALWIGKVMSGDKIVLRMRCQGENGIVIVDNNNTHMTVLQFQNLS